MVRKICFFTSAVKHKIFSLSIYFQVRIYVRLDGLLISSLVVVGSKHIS